MSVLRLFRCPEYAATITTTACVSRHGAAAREHRPGAEGAWHFSQCRGCAIGQAHATGRDAPGVSYTERVVASAPAAPAAPARVAVEPIAAGAPTPDLAAQDREARRAAAQREYERRNREARNARRRKPVERSSALWDAVASHVAEWTKENPVASRAEHYERARRELGLTQDKNRFLRHMRYRLGGAPCDRERGAVDARDAHIRALMEPAWREQPKRGSGWHAKRLREAGVRVSADRVKRVLRALREEAA